MSIEDVNYMKENSIKQSYTFIVDSFDRDRNMYPNPNNYVVNFSTPFKNIIGMEIIDASIPRAMYTIDVDNNEIYYYIGNDTDDEIIEKGVQINNNANLILKNWNYISNSYNISHLEISGNKYAILNNSINLFNIYNNANNIGGSTVGITFNLCFNSLISQYNNKYNIIDFSYDHIYLNDAGTDIIFKNISIDIEKNTEGKHILTFAIGSHNEVININYNNYINIYWSILNTTWYIGIFDINNTLIEYKKILNCDKIYNVFYTKKYIGKKHDSLSIWGTNILQFKDFKIYNVPMTTLDIMLYTLSSINEVSSPINTLPVWFKMKEIINNTIINSSYNSTIDYKDIFKKIYIIPGDYTFKTFISKFNDLLDPDEIEIMFKETSTPPELTNLIDIYSKSPLLIDMKRSTITENLGFDLYPTQNNEDKYISKPYTNTDSVLAKMFYSRLNTSYNTETGINKYIITSPGIVYFIGNKYIIMRCPEIEEHLYRSLSYSKYTLGLAKFRVDSVGINSEKLTITKLPVREFHPIGKLSRITLRFETKNGILYDFKGINHNIIFAIFYYEPIQKNIPTISILNPEYKMNYLDYLYKQEEIEGDSDDDNKDNNNQENIIEDFSRDNIDDFKVKEQLYNENGVKLQQFNNYYQNNNQSVIMENEDNSEDDSEDDSEDNNKIDSDDNEDNDNINYNDYFVDKDNE